MCPWFLTFLRGQYMYYTPKSTFHMDPLYCPFMIGPSAVGASNLPRFCRLITWKPLDRSYRLPRQLYRRFLHILTGEWLAVYMQIMSIAPYLSHMASITWLCIGDVILLVFQSPAIAPSIGLGTDVLSRAKAEKMIFDIFIPAELPRWYKCVLIVYEFIFTSCICFTFFFYTKGQTPPIADQRPKRGASGPKMWSSMSPYAG